MPSGSKSVSPKRGMVGYFRERRPTILRVARSKHARLSIPMPYFRNKQKGCTRIAFSLPGGKNMIERNREKEDRVKGNEIESCTHQKDTVIKIAGPNLFKNPA